MKLSERCAYFTYFFEKLTCTNSPILKRKMIDDIPEELKDDFTYIVEVLTGKHKFGYTYYVLPTLAGDLRNEDNTVRDILEFLQEPRRKGDLSDANILRYCNATYPWQYFFEPIVNRKLKLGIGNSILPKDGLAPMLAKKYEGKIKYDPRGYVLTEKLDGNRCIASYEDDHWVFRSRNGKLMHVDFDMGDLPREFVYDGEVMSFKQTVSSMILTSNLKRGILDNRVYNDDFSETSGLINRHTLNKDLVYNIFDIMLDDVPYYERRLELDKISSEIDLPTDIRIVPALVTSDIDLLESTAANFLHSICNMGGEGLMINLASATYSHKRTDQLLKFKQVQSMDMRVIDIQEGNGKYTGMVGAIWCECHREDGTIVTASVGSGLSDEQRLEWALHPNNILGKIVEIQYFSLSQDSKNKGSDFYSLRFPRLKTVRADKTISSEF